MGHSIRALVGKSESIDKFADDWVHSSKVDLEQGYALIMITDELHDDVNEFSDNQSSDPFEEFVYLSSSLNEIFIRDSFKTKLAYIETDYFGGTGSQAVILYEDGVPTVGPLITEDIWDEKSNGFVQKPKGARAINQVLKKMGVWCKSSDEFESLGLVHYRSME